ncbi:hypothetical protein Ari01nite_77520 [Paractinoplanes rishiriensis]|uniref:Uncharacterized protein n=1 Tax=Paractinoplanes rishiriensis TaxID=1050105 RepID=A0A919K7P8_9ACTN|nr:hypothetical protein Ari01nite_77520 [Actinoplanes rishiriensis]
MLSASDLAENRVSAGPAVSVVAKIHNASSATSGTVIIAMIFERIDQLRVLIRLRPRVDRLQQHGGQVVTVRVRLPENT